MYRGKKFACKISMKTKDGRPIVGKKELREWLTNHVETDFESAKLLFSDDDAVWKEESKRVQQLFRKEFSPASGQHVTVLVIMDHYKSKKPIKSKSSAWSKALRDRFDSVRARVIWCARNEQHVQHVQHVPADSTVDMLPQIEYFKYIARTLAADESLANRVLCSDPDPGTCRTLQETSDRTNGAKYGGSAALLSQVFSEFHEWDGDLNNQLAHIFCEFNRVLKNFSGRKTRVVRVPPPPITLLPAEEQSETDDTQPHNLSINEINETDAPLPVIPVLGASASDEFVIDDNFMFLQPSKRGYIIDWNARTVRAGVNPKRVRYANGDE